MSLINFQILGCRLNEAEIEQWSQQYQQFGHEITTDSTEADLIVFNSCAVTSEADKKSKKLINRLSRQNPEAKLLVTGCHATLNEQKVADHLGVDFVINNMDKSKLVDKSLSYFNLSQNLIHKPVSHSIFKRGKQRAFIKIQDGCRYRCTFCIVTIARGVESSRSINSIIDEINLLHQQGVQECVLTGVHVGGYGSDIESNLYDLVAEILNRTQIPRIRFASVEPWDLPDNFFSLFENKRLMPHMHMPLQSGSDTVLRRMSRRCKTKEFAELVKKAKGAVEGFSITTDIIVGFPGETEEEWQQTVDFINEISFSSMHIFSYSPREGTKAEGLANQIPNAVKKARNKQLHEIESILKKQSLELLIGQETEVMWEHETTDGSSIWQGHTPHFHKVVCFDDSIKPSDISKVKIIAYEPERQVLRAQSLSSPKVTIELNF